jgi:hypothetical protein
VTVLVVDWPAAENEHGGQLLWHGSWLLGEDGVEGDEFYRGRGGTTGSYDVPPGTAGVRIRRWPHEAFGPEYADIVPLPPGRRITAGDLDFERMPVAGLLPRLLQEYAIDADAWGAGRASILDDTTPR